MQILQVHTSEGNKKEEAGLIFIHWELTIWERKGVLQTYGSRYTFWEKALGKNLTWPQMSWEYRRCVDVLEVLGVVFDDFLIISQGATIPYCSFQKCYLVFSCYCLLLNVCPIFHCPQFIPATPLPSYRIMPWSIIKSTDEFKIPQTVFK